MSIKHNIRPRYADSLIKSALRFLSEVDYILTAHFIDLRNGSIYISLIGLAASDDEQKRFTELDKQYGYMNRLINRLQGQANDLGIMDIRVERVSDTEVVVFSENV